MTQSNQTQSRRLPIPWQPLLAGIVLAGFAGLLWFFYQGGGRADGPIEVVLAPEGPIKIKPEDLGGMEVPHRDVAVLKAAGGEASNALPRITQAPEEPMDLSQMDQPSAPEVKDEDSIGEQIEKLLAVEPGTTPWRVQLAAFTDLNQAENYWDIMLEDHPRLMRGLSKLIEPTTARGQQFFRLRAGPLADEAAANRLCAALTQAGKGCLTVAPPP